MVVLRLHVGALRLCDEPDADLEEGVGLAVEDGQGAVRHASCASRLMSVTWTADNYLVVRSYRGFTKSVFVALAATSCQRSGKRLQNAAALAKASSGTD